MYAGKEGASVACHPCIQRNLHGSSSRPPWPQEDRKMLRCLVWRPNSVASQSGVTAALSRRREALSRTDIFPFSCPFVSPPPFSLPPLSSCYFPPGIQFPTLSPQFPCPSHFSYLVSHPSGIQLPMAAWPSQGIRSHHHFAVVLLSLRRCGAHESNFTHRHRSRRSSRGPEPAAWVP